MFLIIGGDSEIGAATARHLLKNGHTVVVTTRRPEYVTLNRPFLELSSIDGWEPPPHTRAACVCAAVSRLVDCERDPVGSARVNVAQTIALCERFIARGIYVLLLSTNQVFDGTTPHVLPDVPTSPVSEYGRQKAQTEAALKTLITQGASAGILRLARVVSPDMPILRNWISALSCSMPIRAFHDMTLAPTPIDTVAEAITRLLGDQSSGIFQLTGPRDVSYESFGRRVALRVVGDETLVRADSALSEQPKGAARPHTTLDSSLLQRRYGMTVPDPWIVLDEIISRQIGQSPSPSPFAGNVR
jgi:dTDP-4-dehydrorhamnose reductase